MSTIKYPTDEAWRFFMLHHDDIRQVCSDFLPVPEVQIPNTRVGITGIDGVEVITEQRAAFHLAVRHDMAEFDAAVVAKDSDILCRIMNDAWLRAPESRSVYAIPGFTRMCDLLDCTVDGFVDNGSYEEPAP